MSIEIRNKMLKWNAFNLIQTFVSWCNRYTQVRDKFHIVVNKSHIAPKSKPSVFFGTSLRGVLKMNTRQTKQSALSRSCSVTGSDRYFYTAIFLEKYWWNVSAVSTITIWRLKLTDNICFHWIICSNLHSQCKSLYTYHISRDLTKHLRSKDKQKEKNKAR